MKKFRKQYFMIKNKLLSIKSLVKNSLNHDYRTKPEIRKFIEKQKHTQNQMGIMFC